VDPAEDAVNLGLDMGKFVIRHGAELIGIIKLELYESIRSLVADGPPFKAVVEGVVRGQYFCIHF
jgi:hypothetical protein